MTEVQTGTLIPYLTEMFRMQAWILLGKVVHPVTGKIERDLGGARQMIDLLAELETRTEGNRSADETRLLRGALTELRLNYLDEMKKPAEDVSAGKAEAAEAPKPESTEPSS
jgi:uncharacterized protein DUF1844